MSIGTTAHLKGVLRDNVRGVQMLRDGGHLGFGNLPLAGKVRKIEGLAHVVTYQLLLQTLYLGEGILELAGREAIAQSLQHSLQPRLGQAALSALINHVKGIPKLPLPPFSRGLIRPPRVKFLVRHFVVAVFVHLCHRFVEYMGRESAP